MVDRPVSQRPDAVEKSGTAHVVQARDSLWSIASEGLRQLDGGSHKPTGTEVNRYVKQIAQHNNLKNADRIFDGKTLYIPEYKPEAPPKRSMPLAMEISTGPKPKGKLNGVELGRVGGAPEQEKAEVAPPGPKGQADAVPPGPKGQADGMPAAPKGPTELAPLAPKQPERVTRDTVIPEPKPSGGRKPFGEPENVCGGLHELSGTASWYGKSWHGRQMANGRPFDMNAMTIAHKTLPKGTVLDLTSLDTGKTVRAEVTDRGPYIGNRVFDGSSGVARALDYVVEGLTKIKASIVSCGDNAYHPSPRPHYSKHRNRLI